MISRVSTFVPPVTATTAAERHVPGPTTEDDVIVDISDDALRHAQGDERDDAELHKLQARDRLVREQSQSAATAGSSVLVFKTGPDGQRYATEAQVHVNVAPGPSAEQTLARARQLRAVAMAQSDPGTSDRTVAAAASRLEAVGRADLAHERRAGGEQWTQAVENSVFEQAVSREGDLPLAGVALAASAAGSGQPITTRQPDDDKPPIGSTMDRVA